MPLPEFLQAPAGVALECSPERADAAACASLLEGAYWNDRFTREDIITSHLESSASSDGSKYAWIYDVVVAPEWRGKHVGDAVMRLLLDHPAVRRARFVKLGTRDAMGFYERMGFVASDELPKRPYVSVEMVRAR
jgi:ribosomal protein S18 acetylase RimI-like enzyme